MIWQPSGRCAVFLGPPQSRLRPLARPVVESSVKCEFCNDFLNRAVRIQTCLLFTAIFVDNTIDLMFRKKECNRILEITSPFLELQMDCRMRLMASPDSKSHPKSLSAKAISPAISRLPSLPGTSTKPRENFLRSISYVSWRRKMPLNAP